MHGFQNDRFVMIMQFYFSIINGKVWVFKNSTDVDLDTEFTRMNIPKSDIVIDFLPEYERKYSEYAVA